MTTTEIIMAVFALINLVLCILAWRRTGKKDTEAEVEDDTSARADLRYVMRGVDDIRVDVRAMRGDMSAMDRRLVVVEESTKSAHKRLDEHIKMHPPDYVRELEARQ